MLTKPPVPYDLYVADPKKALVGAFSVITNLRMELFEALTDTQPSGNGPITSAIWPTANWSPPHTPLVLARRKYIL